MKRNYKVNFLNWNYAFVFVVTFEISIFDYLQKRQVVALDKANHYYSETETFKVFYRFALSNLKFKQTYPLIIL